jgi:hypothetical protein
LVNLILHHFGYPQIIFPLSERDFYFQCLFFAQMGDVRRFIRYVAGLVEDTLKVKGWKAVANVNDFLTLY